MILKPVLLARAFGISGLTKLVLNFIFLRFHLLLNQLSSLFYERFKYVLGWFLAILILDLGFEMVSGSL